MVVMCRIILCACAYLRFYVVRVPFVFAYPTHKLTFSENRFRFSGVPSLTSCVGVNNIYLIRRFIRFAACLL